VQAEIEQDARTKVEEDGDQKSRRPSPHRRGFAKQDDDRRRLHDSKTAVISNGVTRHSTAHGPKLCVYSKL